MLRLLQQMDSLSPPLSIHSIASPAVIEKGTQLLVSKMYLFINNEFYAIHPKLRTRVRLAVSRQISAEYERLYNAVHDPQNGYINVDAIMLHTPQQIKTLLDCEWGCFLSDVCSLCFRYGCSGMVFSFVFYLSDVDCQIHMPFLVLQSKSLS